MPPAKKIKKKDPTYASYLHKVLKSVNPKDVTISSAAMDLVNGLVEDLENRLANKAVEMAKLHRKSTLAAKHVQVATKLVVPGEMAAHALSEGTKAVTKFFAH